MATVAAPLRHFSSRQFVCCCCSGYFPALSYSFSSSNFSNGGTRFSKSVTYFPAFGLGERRRIFSSSGFAFPSVVSAPARRFVKLEGRSPYADSAFLEEDADYAAEEDTKKSRNQKKRDARRAVQWGMDLAKFSPAQIKLILRVASFDNEVFDAIMLAKRLGPDVREGRRRQFSYVGKLLRNAEPELMDEMIRAMKDGDVSRIQALSSQETIPLDDEFDGEENVEQYDSEDDVDQGTIEIAERWLDGLIEKDASVINEVYSINDGTFDRQELRKLVRRVQSLQNREDDSVKADLTKSKSSLSRFLIQLAKDSTVE